MPTLVCPSHGLRYDPAVADGCVRCHTHVATSAPATGVLRRALLVGTVIAGDLASPRLRFYLFTRQDDFNRPATAALESAMQAKGCRVTRVERPGGHAPMEAGEVEEALAWMNRVA